MSSARSSSTKRAALSKETPRRALLVLGMHRSGTSALTRVLGLAGAALPSHLMAATDANERGYFESVPIYQLHEEMFEAFGTSTHDLSPMPANWLNSELAIRFIDRMVDIVREEYGAHPLFVIKDPRLCRLVPFWLEVLARLDVEPSFLIPVRNPLEVSASLERALDIDEQRGRLLWLQHFLLAERDTRDHARSILTYNQLLDDWRSVVGRIQSELELALPRLSRRAGAEIDGFLTPALRHHDLPTKGVEVRADVGQWVKTAYAWVERAAQGKRPSFRTLDRVGKAFFAAEAAFGPVLAETEYRRAEEAKATLRLREELEKRWVEREVEFDSLREAMQHSSTLVDRLTAENDELAKTASTIPELEGELRRHAIELARLRSETLRIPKLRARLLESEAARERSEERVALALEEKTTELRGALEERMVEVARLRREAVRIPDRTDLPDPPLIDENVEEPPNVEENRDLPGRLFESTPEALERQLSSSRILALPRRAAKLAYWTITFQLAARLGEHRAGRRLRDSGLFDDHYYRAQAADVADGGGDPVPHYLRHGAREGRNPNAAFDTRYYLENNRDVLDAGLNPLDHFASHGWRERRSPHPLFDVDGYLSVHPDLAKSGENPLHHWLHGGSENQNSATLGNRSSEIDTPAASAKPAEVPTPETQTIVDLPKTIVSLEEINVVEKVRRAADPDDPIIVVVSHEIPHAPRAGNQYRISRYIAWLEQRGYQVITVFCPLANSTASETRIREAAQILGNLVVCHRDGRVQTCIAAHLFPLLDGLDGQGFGPFDPDPERIEGENEDEYQERIVLEHAFCPDVLVQTLLHIDQRIERPAAFITCYAFVTRYLSRLRPETLSVIDTIDVFSSKDKKVDAFGVFNELRLSKIQERALLRRGHVTMAIQAEEAREFERLVPDRPVLTIGVDFDCAPETSAPLPARDCPPTIAFVASGNAMNRKGIDGFLRHCWPLILRDHPDARLRLAGAVGESVSKEAPGVEVLGKVDSLGEFYRNCHVVINPVAAGTGLKIKTVEAIAHHRPIVTWPLGVEGVPPPLLRYCRVARDWYEFYLEVSKRLCMSPGEPAFSRSDRALIAEQLSSGHVYRLLGDLLDQHCRGIDAEMGEKGQR